MKIRRSRSRYGLALAGSVVGSWLAPAAAQLLGPEFQVNTTTLFTQRFPAVAADDAGAFVVVWQSSQPSGLAPSILGQRFDPAGDRVGTEFQVNSGTPTSLFYPAVASDDVGNFVVVWGSAWQDGSSWGIFGQRFDAAGARLGSEFQVNTFTTNSQTRPAAASGGSGDFVVAWESDPLEGRSTGIFGQRFDAGGARLGSEFQVSSTTAGRHRAAALAMDGAGNFVVVWENDEQDGSSKGVFGQRFDAGGNRLGSEFQVHTSTTGSQYAPAVAADAAGNFVVVWQGVGGVFARRFNAAGSPFGNEFHVAEGQRPAVAADGAGGFLVSWDGTGQGGSESDVFGQRFDPDGQLWGGEFRINSYTTSYQQGPAVAVGAAGEFVAIWNSDQDGWDTGVFGQRIAGTGVGCTAGGATLCLHHNRFHVEVSWRNYAGQTGFGQAVPFSEESGMFWFFSPGNLEFLVKVIDGCSFNSRYWVYAAATTDVEYTMTVTDTWQEVANTYTNGLGTAAPAITDSAAFATCP